ncbi:uncharacterized protein [Littorina saxatilis]|uniref:Uncharacterized protein n=1 Tax=Littorina saxatilis TaxID=31220 RepID=A0AAN9GAE4_9CAEN
MSRSGARNMAPDSRSDNSPLPDASNLSPDVEVMITPVSPTTLSPLPCGILFKGNKPKRRVTFRDTNLVNIREIPPRSRSGSTGSGDEDESDEDDSCSSDSDDDSDSGSEEEVVVTKKKTVTALSYKDKGVTVTRTTPSPPVSTLVSVSPAPGSRVRPERAPIPWSSPSPPFSGAKGSYEISSSPASKVVSLVSQITGVSSAATQAHIKQRTHGSNTNSGSNSGGGGGGGGGSVSPSPRPSPPPKKTQAVRVEKKVKKITPTLETVMTHQTVRSMQRLGTMAEMLHKGANASAGKSTTKKKRVLHRRQEGETKRKTGSSRKSKENKHATSHSSSTSGNGGNSIRVNGVSPTHGKNTNRSTVNGFSNIRDSMSLPRLGAGSDDTTTSTALPSSRTSQHMSLPKSTLYTLDGFIFPGDPANDLVAGVKAVSVSPGPEDAVRVKPVVPAATPITTPSPNPPHHHHPSRERISSAPPGSANRRRRYYAWQMANGNLHSSLHESPCITPMWETVQPMASVTGKPVHDR